MRSGQFGWYALQGAVIVGVLVFFLEVINPAFPDEPVSPHVALIIGVVLAVLITAAVSGSIGLVRRLLPKRQSSVGKHRR